MLQNWVTRMQGNKLYTYRSLSFSAGNVLCITSWVTIRRVRFTIVHEYINLYNRFKQNACKKVY